MIEQSAGQRKDAMSEGVEMGVYCEVVVSETIVEAVRAIDWGTRWWR